MAKEKKDKLPGLSRRPSPAFEIDNGQQWAFRVESKTGGTLVVRYFPKQALETVQNLIRCDLIRAGTPEAPFLLAGLSVTGYQRAREIILDQIPAKLKEALEELIAEVSSQVRRELVEAGDLSIVDLNLSQEDGTGPSPTVRFGLTQGLTREIEATLRIGDRAKRKRMNAPE